MPIATNHSISAKSLSLIGRRDVMYISGLIYIDDIYIQVADKNNDGYISKAEFQKLAKNLNKEQVTRKKCRPPPYTPCDLLRTF